MNRLLRGALIVMIALGPALPGAAQAYSGTGPILGVLSPPGPVELTLAYVDPGAAGFVIVTVLGFFAAIGYTARAYLSRIKQMLLRRGSPAQDGETPDP